MDYRRRVLEFLRDPMDDAGWRSMMNHFDGLEVECSVFLYGELCGDNPDYEPSEEEEKAMKVTLERCRTIEHVMQVCVEDCAVADFLDPAYGLLGGRTGGMGEGFWMERTRLWAGTATGVGCA